jgi:RHS repeat-associated protein
VSDWAVLDRTDPAPGDVEGTRALGRRLLEQASLVEHETGRLRSLAGQADGLKMAGDYAAEYTSALTGLPDDLSKLGVAYRGCGTALTRYADDLAGAQTKAGRALADGSDADVRYRAALRDLQHLLPPDQQSLASSSLNLTPSAVETATLTLDESTREQIRHAASRARTADADLDRARTLADQAAALRGDAEERATRGIGDALEDSGLKNKSWLQKAWDTVSKPFRSWDDFVSLCGKVALIAGTAALFISGPIGWALMAAALVASAAIFANDLMRYSKGEVGLGTLAFDALGLIPGGRGVVSLSRWGKGLGTLGRALTRPGGFRTLASAGRGALGRVTSAFPRVLDRAKGIRQALGSPLKFARSFDARTLCRDPVDAVTGEMVMRTTDLELPGLLPIILERTYTSAYGVGDRFGPSWSSFLDQRLEVDAQGVCFAATEALLLSYPAVAPGGTAGPHEGPQFTLGRRADGHYYVREPDTGRTLWFAPPPETTPETTEKAGASGLGVILPLAAISDQNGNRIDIGYDAVTGWPTELLHTGGYTVAVECQAGLITAFRVQEGEPVSTTTIVRYGYDEHGRLIEVADSAGRPLRFGYDRFNRIVSWTDRNGTWYRYTYDEEGRVVRTTGAGHCLSGEMVYDTTNRVTVEVNSLGARTAYHYDEQGQVVREVDPLGRATERTWDGHRRQLSETDPLGRTTRFVHDENTDLVQVVRPDGLTFDLRYDQEHRLVEARQPDGGQWSLEYDTAGNLTGQTDPTGATFRFAHDAQGAVRSQTDPAGHVTTFTNDRAGLPIGAEDPLGARFSARRDAFGRVIEGQDPLGRVTRYGWTVEGHPAEEVGPDGTRETWRYDGEGNQIGHNGPAGHLTTIERTFFDLPSACTDALGSRVSLSYDTELRLTSVTDPRGLVWRYEYDLAGQMVRQTDYDGLVTEYTYDAAGQLVRQLNGAGQTLEFAYDHLGNVTAWRSDEGVTSLAYDAMGYLQRARNPHADMTFRRDGLGRVLSETTNGRAVESLYDRAGNRIGRRTPSGLESRWSFDAAGLPQQLAVAGQTFRFQHDGAGQEVSRAAGQVLMRQAWGSAGELLEQTVTAGPGENRAVVEHRELSYDEVGQLRQVDDSRRGRRSYQLDPLNRVTEVRSGASGRRQRYTYDPAGNPIREGIGRTVTGSQVVQAGEWSYTYDARGRMVSRTRSGDGGERQWRFGWNAEDRLTAVQTPEGDQWRYLYDPLGRRIAKQGRSRAGEHLGLVHFSWDDLTLAEAVEVTGDTVRARSWDWHPDQPRVLSQVNGGDLDRTCHWVTSDPVGSPLELLDLEGRSVWSSEAGLWGAGERAASAFPLGFPGQFRDTETGLSYNLHRYYDPDLASYLSGDPLQLGAGYNHRAYVPNPLLWSDPTGLVPCWLTRSSLAQRAFTNRWIGVESPLVGNKFARGTHGLINKPGSPLKFGWSGTGNQGGGWQLRLGVGVNPLKTNQARWHQYLSISHVPNGVANPLLQAIRQAKGL